MISLPRLNNELVAAGLPVPDGSSVALHKLDEARTWPNATFYVRAEGKVRVNWIAPAPSPAQDAQAATIVAAHDGNPTETEKLDRLGLPGKVLSAIALRLSDRWTTVPPAGATAAEKARAMAIIDAAGQRVLNEIRS